MEDISKIISNLNTEMAKAEENVFKQVLRNLLKREPTIEDAKDCERIMTEGDFEGYSLAYKGLMLGRIQRNFPDLNIGTAMYSVSFIPAEMKDFLEPLPSKKTITLFTPPKNG